MRSAIFSYIGVLFLLLCSQELSSVTLVYNLRVRRIFNVPEVLERIQASTIFSVVPIFFHRTSEIETRTCEIVCETRNAGGALLNLRYVPSQHGWAEITTGIEKDSGTFRGADPFKVSRTGVDDIVFSGGYRYFVDNWQLVAYGLVGLPTRRSVTLCDRHGPLVGSRLYNLGVGSEVSYSFISELKRSLAAIGQVRLIHGFNRRWFPILPTEDIIQPGNGTDLFFSLQWREKRTVFEAGYDATIFNNQAIIKPTQKITTDTFVRHSGFARIAHGFEQGLFDKPTVIGAGFNVNSAQRFNAKAFVVWVYATQLF